MRLWTKDSNNRALKQAMAAFALCLISMPVWGTVLDKMPGSERSNVARLIAVGTTPIDIRVSQIHDSMLVSAILKGSKTRSVRILVDYKTDELGPLIGNKNVQIHVSSAGNRGEFGKHKLSYSFVLELGKGYFREWDGPLIWTKNAFGPSTQFFEGNGYGPGEPWFDISRKFDRDFSSAHDIQTLGTDKK